MAKSRKLLLYVLAIALLLWGFWLVVERPSFSTEGAFRRAERRELRAESAFLGHFFLTDVLRIGTGHVDYHLTVGKSRDSLYLAEAVKHGLFWESEEDTVVIPLEDPVTADFQPWCAEWRPTAFVYTDLPYACGVAVVTVGGRTFDARFESTKSGFALISFPAFDAAGHTEDRFAEQIRLRQFDLRGMGYDKARKNTDVSLEVVLYDSANAEVARITKDYPAS